MENRKERVGNTSGTERKRQGERPAYLEGKYIFRVRVE